MHCLSIWFKSYEFLFSLSKFLIMIRASWIWSIPLFMRLAYTLFICILLMYSLSSSFLAKNEFVFIVWKLKLDLRRELFSKGWMLDHKSLNVSSRILTSISPFYSFLNLSCKSIICYTKKFFSWKYKQASSLVKKVLWE